MAQKTFGILRAVMKMICSARILGVWFLAVGMLVVSNGCVKKTAGETLAAPDEASQGQMKGGLWLNAPANILSGEGSSIFAVTEKPSVWAKHKINPNAVDMNKKSFSALQDNDWLSAVRYASAAIDLDSEYALAYINRSWAYAEKGVYAAATEDGRKAISLIEAEFCPSMKAECRSGITRAPQLGAAYCNLGLAYQRTGQLSLALDQYRRACELGNETGCRNLKQVDDWVIAFQEKSKAALNKGQYEEAVSTATNIIELVSNNVDALIIRGAAFTSLGRIDEAIADHERAVALAPQNGFAYNGLGIALEKKGSVALAQLNFEMSCQLGVEPGCQNAVRLISGPLATDPQNAQAYTNRAKAYIGMGMYEEAMTDCQKALSLAPNMGAAWQTHGDAFLGKLDLDAAFSSYRQACAHGMRSACAALQADSKEVQRRGDSAFAAGQYRTAEIAMSQVLASDPNNVTALITRAGARTYLGQYPEAIADCQRAIELDARNGMAYNNLGFAFEQQGETAKAQLNYEESCGLQEALGCRNLKHLEKN